LQTPPGGGPPRGRGGGGGEKLALTPLEMSLRPSNRLLLAPPRIIIAPLETLLRLSKCPLAPLEIFFCASSGATGASSTQLSSLDDSLPKGSSVTLLSNDDSRQLRDLLSSFENNFKVGKP
jgi:hypothetical protein